MCAKPAKRHAPAFPTSLCGVLVFDSVSRHLLLVLLPPPHPRLSHTTLSPTIFHTQSFTRIFVNHHLSHIIFHTHTQLCRRPPSFTHNLSLTTLSPTIFHTHLCQPPAFTHHLSHTTLSPTLFHTHLCHPPSFTHIRVTHHLSHTTLSHTNFVTHHLSHTTLSHTNFVTHHLSYTIFHASHCHPPSFTHIFVVWRGRRGAWQAWHLGHGAGSGGAWTGLVAGDAAALCVADVALGDIHLRFGHGTWRHPLSFRVAGVARGALAAGSGGALGLDWRHFA